MKQIILLLGGLLLVEAVAATELRTVEAARVEVPSTYRLDGVVEPVQQSTVSAQTAGQVAAVQFDVEDFVEQGAVLVQLKDSEQRAQVNLAEANIKVADAQLADAQQEFGRIKGLFKKKLVSQKDMDQATAAKDTASARREAAVAALAQAQEQLSYTLVRAPYTGIVTRRSVEVGEMVQPGSELMTGVSLEQLRVAVDVPQSLLPQVRHHDQGQIQLPDDGWINAKDVTIFPFADQGSHTFRVRLALPSGKYGLFPGMLVKTAFVIGTKNALVIPERSVVLRSEVTGVYVVGKDGRVELRYVRVGHSLGDGRVAVLAGLSEGEQVATDTIEAGVMLKAQQARSVQQHG